MKTRIVRIGNSLGVRIPKRLLEQTGLHGDVEITVRDRALVIGPIRKSRAGWATSFRRMARRGHDALFDDAPPSVSAWDEDEWEWR